MSKENVEIVRRVWDAADRRDTEAALSLYESNVELDVSGFPPLAAEERVYRGHEGLRRLYGEWGESFTEADSELVEVIDRGDRVVTVYKYRARGRLSGTPVSGLFATVWTLHEGKITRVAWFYSREEALKAAGLSE